MHKTVPLILTVGCIVLLAAFADLLGLADTSQPLGEPPALTVRAEDAEVQAWRGTYTWHVDDGEGMSRGVSSDSIHPLAAGAWMTPLAPAGAETVVLDFGTAPDAVTVRAWGAAHLVPDTHKSDEVSANVTPEDDAQAVAVPVSGSAGEGWTFALLAEDAVYEIRAEWTRAADYGGSARYAFYTTQAAASA